MGNCRLALGSGTDDVKSLKLERVEGELLVRMEWFLICGMKGIRDTYKAKILCFSIFGGLF